MKDGGRDMDGRKLSLAVSVLLGLVLPVCFIVQMIAAGMHMPEAKNGRMDLREWNFAEDGVVPLKGEWEFYRDQLLMPASPLPDTAVLAEVPSPWNEVMKSEDSPGSHGYGTYRMVIRINKETDELYGIHTGNIRMANRIYINGREAGASGVPSESADTFVQNNVPYVGFAPVTGEWVEIIVQVSNYAYASGGIIIPISFGKQHAVLQNREWRVLQDLISAIGFIIPAVYLLLFYRKLRKEHSLLHLGLMCLACCLFVLTHGEKLLAEAVPWLSYGVLLKIQAISSLFIYYFLLLYTSVVSLTPVTRTKMLRMLKIVLIVLLICSIVLPTNLLSSMDQVSTIPLFCTVLFVLFNMLRSLTRTSNNIIFESLSILSLLLVIVLQALMFFGILDTSSIVSYEMLFFVIMQAMMMASRFADSYKEVEELSRRLLTLDGLKDEFLANTSHELRTPLHGIINMADSLIEGAAGNVTEEQSRHIAMIAATGKRLSSLIHDILDFSSLKNGNIKLNFRPVHLPTAAESVIEVVKHTAGSKNIRFIQEWPADLPLLYADEDRLVQVLYNLIGNAVKFTQEGEIRISAAIIEEKAVITVADTGIGMHVERLEDVFHSDHQNVDYDVSSNKGSGFGLGIAKKLVELGGGRIWLEPKREIGTAIHFTSPVAGDEELADRAPYQSVKLIADSGMKESAAAIEGMLRDAKQASGGIIMIVDDDPVNLQVLHNLLSVERYQVIALSSGEAALSEIRNNSNIDLVIADWMMPGMSGIELTRLIRERYLLSELPVLLLTARSYPDDMEKAFRTGINDFLGKPMESKELRARVRTLIQLKQSVQQAIQSEMAFLQAQIKPHFLYNALNTVIAICPDNPEKASLLLMELSQFLRGSFDFHNRDRLVPLQQELELVKSYLTLEHARFEERLLIRYELGKEMYTLIPPLSIQPLVENAIRHGIMRKSYGGMVTIAVQETEREIVISVTDDGVGMSRERVAAVLAGTAEGRKGVGLRNIHQRLIAFYGKGLHVTSREGEGTTVSFTMARANIAERSTAGVRSDLK
jgi:sensor histidine kinase YesM